MHVTPPVRVDGVLARINMAWKPEPFGRALVVQYC